MLGLGAGNEGMTIVQVELLHQQHLHLPSQNAKDLLTQQTSAHFASMLYSSSLSDQPAAWQ